MFFLVWRNHNFQHSKMSKTSWIFSPYCVEHIKLCASWSFPSPIVWIMFVLWLYLFGIFDLVYFKRSCRIGFTFSALCHLTMYCFNQVFNLHISSSDNGWLLMLLHTGLFKACLHFKRRASVWFLCWDVWLSCTLSDASPTSTLDVPVERILYTRPKNISRTFCLFQHTVQGWAH